MSEYTDIQVEIEDPTCVIRLNRPDKLNAFTYHTLNEIRAAIDSATVDARVVGIIITGNGRGFCAGLDAQVLASVTGGDADVTSQRPTDDDLPGIFSYLLEVPKPVIAAVNGVAAGGGLILALMSDLRIASKDASFTTIFLKRGLISEHGSSWLLPRLIGAGRALDLLWTSDRIDAETAADIGLVEKLVDAGGRVRFDQLDLRLPQGMVSTKLMIEFAEMDEDAAFSWSSVLLAMTASMDMRVPIQLYEFAQMMNPQAESLVAMGILKREGDDYVTVAVYAQGLLNVNGAPMPIPMPTM